MQNRPHRQFWILPAIIAMTLVVVCLIFPPVRFVSLKKTHSLAVSTAFQPAVFASEFWSKQLLPAARNAPDAVLVIQAFQKESAAAKSKYGKTSGLGGPVYYLVSGDGKVAAKDTHTVTIQLQPPLQANRIVIDLAPTFGNAVRDGSGLLNVSDFPNSLAFNHVAESLNSMADQCVGKIAADSKIGSVVHFAGVVESSQDASPGEIWHLIPLLVEVQ